MYSLGPDLLLSSSKKNKEINLKTREFANLESRSHAFDNLEEDLMDLTRDILDTDANFSRFKVGIRKGSNRIGIGNHLENSKSAVSLERSQSAISWLHSEREKVQSYKTVTEKYKISSKLNCVTILGGIKGNRSPKPNCKSTPS